MIRELIETACIVPGLAATEKIAVFGEMLDALEKAGQITKRERTAIKKLLVQREEQGSTGLGNGIAVPHVKAGVKRVILALANSHEGVPFDAIDGRPVHTLFMVIAPKAEPQEHLHVLRWISSLARNADFRRFVLSSKTEADIRELLEEMSEAS